MKKLFRIVTVIQVVWQGYRWYQDRQNNKNTAKKSKA
jgi:hypothetical protein